MSPITYLYSKLNNFISLWKQLKSEKKILNKPNRSQSEFKKKYPHSSMGINCYGVPSIKHKHKDANLTIGNYCSIAKNVEIYLGGNHRVDWVTTYPFPRYFKELAHIPGCAATRGNVEIGSDVWLCQNVTILSGVKIGHGAVVANGAIVTKDVPPYAIVGGNPAKLIRWRFDEETRKALLKSAWWDWPEDEVLKAAPLLCSDNIADFLRYTDSRNQQSKIK